MAQQDFGGSWAAQRYCHSLARISGHVAAEQGGSSAKRPIAITFAFCVRKRHSSYSQIPRSTPGGGWASDCAVALSMATRHDWVNSLCSAFRCSVNWKAESIWTRSGQLLLTQGQLRKHTCCSSTSGGPSCISSAFVPGLILLEASTSAFCEAPSILSSLSRPALGEIWSSAIGGGLGSRGELDGDAMMCDDLYKRRCSEEKERPSTRSRKGQHAIGCDCDRSDTCPWRLLHARPSIRQDPLRAPTSSLYIYFTNRFLCITAYSNYEFRHGL